MSKNSASSTAGAICGFDVGSENCYIAVARAGGIEILLNDYSQRSTPAYIAFGDKQRLIGVAAKQKQLMNLSNTCFEPNRLIGKQFKELTEEMPFKVKASPTGEVSVLVWHNGEEMELTATQVLAMLFTKLRQVASHSIDCVINCPVYFTDPQRRALMDSAMIAGLNPIRVISDMTAIGLYYGFYRTAPTQDLSIVGFVDCGQSSTQCSVILFNNKENSVKVLSMEYDANLGGKHFDELMAGQFIKQHKLQLGKRGKFRLLAECEKLKKQMSANSNELPINIECLQDEQDFSSRMDRETFEKLCAGVFQGIEEVFKRAVQSAQDKFMSDSGGKDGEFRIDSVEVVGGTSRIPAIKRLVKKVFGVEASTTLNADEAVARGCALQCAMLSPTFKVPRELHLTDYAVYQIDFRYWHLSPNGNEKDFKSVTGLFPRGHPVPFTKQISIQCNSLPIVVAFDYINDSNQTVPIGEFKIYSAQNLQLSKNQMKLRVRLDPNGIVNVFSASVVVVPSKENVDGQPEDVEMTNASSPNNDNENNSVENNQPMETEEANEKKEESKTNANEKEPQKPKRSKPTAYELQVEPLWIRGKLTETELITFKDIESNLILADKNWKEKIDAKNALEEYVYEWRDRLESGGYDIYLDIDGKNKFMEELRNNEQWLYEQEDAGEILSKSVYEEKINKLKDSFSNDVLYRERENTNRPTCLEQLGQRLQQARKLLDSGGDQNDDPELLKKLQTDISEKQKFFDETSGLLNTMMPHLNPPVTTDQIKQQSDALESTLKSIFYERQRKIDEKKRQEEKKKQEEQNKQAPPPPPESQTNESQEGNVQMDVDPEVAPTI